MSAGGKHREGPELHRHLHQANPSCLGKRPLRGCGLRGSFLPQPRLGRAGGASWLLPTRATLSLLSSNVLWGAHHSLGGSLPRSDLPSLQPSFHVQRRKLRPREGRLVPMVTRPRQLLQKARRRLAALSTPPRAPGSLDLVRFFFHIPSPSPFSVLDRAGSGQLANPQAGWLSHAAPGATRPPPGTCTPPRLLLNNPPGSAGDTRDTGSIPGSGRSPGEGNGNPLQYPCLENPMDAGATMFSSIPALQPLESSSAPCHHHNQK